MSCHPAAEQFLASNPRENGQSHEFLRAGLYFVILVLVILALEGGVAFSLLIDETGSSRQV